MYYYTDIYFDISCEGGGGVFIFQLIAWGIMKICMDLGGDIKNESLKKKSSAPHPPCSIHNECSLRENLSLPAKPALESIYIRKKLTHFSQPRALTHALIVLLDRVDLAGQAKLFNPLSPKSD